MSKNHYTPQQAAHRVYNSPVLKIHSTALIEWPFPEEFRNVDEYVDFLCTASEAEIVKLAERMIDEVVA